MRDTASPATEMEEDEAGMGPELRTACVSTSHSTW